MNDLDKIADGIIAKNPAVKKLTKTELKDLFDLLEKKLLTASVGTMPLDTAIEKYLETVNDAQKEAAKQSIETFIDALGYIFQDPESFEEKSREELAYTVEQWMVEKFISVMYFERNWTQNAARFEISRLNSFYKFLEDNKQLGVNENPFRNIKISRIDYSDSKKDDIPDEQEIQTILNALPVNLAAIVAVTAVRGYSLTEFYQLNFGYAAYSLWDNSVYETGFCFKIDDIWDYDPKNSDDGISQVKTECPAFCPPVPYSYGYYANVDCPAWYNKILVRFWREVVCKNYEDSAVGELYYTNQGINLHSYENLISKKIKELYNQKSISKQYTLKNFRWYAIANIYRKTKNIEELQKLLHHSSPNTTRRFLQNAGIEL